MNTKRRIRVGVLLGGASAEREISLASGQMVARHLPADRYEVVLFDTLALMVGHAGLPPELARRAQALLAGSAVPVQPEHELRDLPSAFRREIQAATTAAAPATEALGVAGRARIDVAFIALHGPYGEDGTLQGMLEMIGIPYVGSGVLASALAMDKAMAKKVLAADGIPVPRGVVIDRDDADPGSRQAARERIPAFVKPLRQGSSIGMTLARDAGTLDSALREAFRFDTRALVEEYLTGRELTVGVIGGRHLTPLPVVEIVSRRDFFDFNAKYDPQLSEEICPANLEPAGARSAQDLAVRAHRALGCRGLSRTDMVLTADRGLVVLEVNTLPGMTVNSLLPKAAEAAGIPFGTLLDWLVRLALGEEPQAPLPPER